MAQLTTPMEPLETTNQPHIITEVATKKYWRPALAWVYVLICLFDFVIAPTTMAAICAAQVPTIEYMHLIDTGYTKEEAIEILKVLPPAPEYKQWQPLTLIANGFFHIAMGGILGIGSFTRGKEKEARVKIGIHSD